MGVVETEIDHQVRDAVVVKGGLENEGAPTRAGQLFISLINERPAAVLPDGVLVGGQRSLLQAYRPVTQGLPRQSRYVQGEGGDLAGPPDFVGGIDDLKSRILERGGQRILPR